MNEKENFSGKKVPQWLKDIMIEKNFNRTDFYGIKGYDPEHQTYTDGKLINRYEMKILAELFRDDHLINCKDWVFEW